VRSIRGRLLVSLLGGMLAVQILTYLLVYARIEDEIDDLFDAELERSALSILSGTSPLPVSAPHRNVVDPREQLTVAWWDAGLPSPRFDGRPLAGLSRSAPAGFSKALIEHREWRLFARASATRTVVAAQPAAVRDIAARRITLRLLLPVLAVIPLAALAILLAVAYGLRPLRRITKELLTRSHRDVAPLATDRLPHDLAPLVHALNDLVQRLGKVIATQSTFIADAAHALLTPLTALKLQTQMLVRAESPRRRREAEDELEGGVSRTLQLARQLLTLARHGVETQSPSLATVDLDEVLRSVLVIHATLAATKQIALEPPRERVRMAVRGQEESLQTLLSSLVDNAIKYTPSRGLVRLSCRHSEGAVEVTLEDSGPGIPAEERERVFDRFYRRAGEHASGSGLGLAIAREIAERHGAAIRLHSSADLGGLSVSIRFPALERPPECANDGMLPATTLSAPARAAAAGRAFARVSGARPAAAPRPPP
jgi:two-component system OmpR family sensor kinase